MPKKSNTINVIKWIVSIVFFAISVFMLFLSWIAFISFEFAVHEYLEHGKLLTGNAGIAFVFLEIAAFISNVAAVMLRYKKVVAIILFVIIMIMLLFLYINFFSAASLVGEDAFRENHIYY